ncbi:spore coat protein [Thalassobacillus hwangdonensis]|uniref:Spore coat protein n=1 Tax=Thalassobacillus hwangdonensis TaxID=546108 RepID=A0ABW3L1U7_9BACI
MNEHYNYIEPSFDDYSFEQEDERFIGRRPGFGFGRPGFGFGFGRPGFGYGFGRPFGFGFPFLTGLAAGALLSPGFGYGYPYAYPPYPYYGGYPYCC